jgi:hypothetical protein
VATVEIESVLARGERLIWEGRPSGYPPIRFHLKSRLAFAAFVLVFIALHLNARGTRAAVPILSFGTTLPNPLVSFFLAFVVNELVTFKAWRTQRYGITDRRILAISLTGSGTLLHWPVSEMRDAMIRGRRLVFIGSLSRPIRFERIEDPEAALSAFNEARSSTTPPANHMGA